MVLDNLSTSLKNSLKKITSALFIDEKTVNELVQNIQRALLAADVNVQLVFNLTNKIKERFREEKPTKDQPKREFLIHIVYEELTNLLGKEKEEIKVLQKKPFKIMLVGLFGSGKCVHPQSLIPLTTGEVITAEKLYSRYNHKTKEFQDDAEIVNIENENLFVPSFNPETLKIENKKATHLWKLKGKNLLKINLDNGNDFSVKVTHEHPFFVLKEGNIKQVRADQLTEEDYITIPKNYEVKPKNESLHSQIASLNIPCYDNKFRIKYATKAISFPEYMNPDLSEFLGYVLGDGHLEERSVQIFNEDEEVLQRVKLLSKNLFNLKISILKDKRSKNLYRISLSSTTLIHILNKLFNIPIGRKGKNLRIPIQVLKDNDINLTHFLRAYFDCEAYPSLNSRQIEVVSESSPLVKDLNLALLRLGIVSTISKKIISDIPYWRLSIRARYAEIYSEKIGFLINRKSEKIKKYKQIGLTQGCGKQDLIPISTLLKESREKSGFSIGEIQNICTSYGRYENFGIISRESLYKVKELYKRKNKGMHHIFLEDIKNNINLKSKYSNPIINSFISYYKQKGIISSGLNLTDNGQILLRKSSQENDLIKNLELLSESDICWVKIKSISNFKLKEKVVYDLSVDGNHSFIADGIIVHNTTTIAKLSNYYKKRNYKVATLGLDVHRPAARHQLKVLSDQVQVPCFIDEKEKDPVKIYKKFEQQYKNYDILIIDTAGRDALLQELIDEIESLNKIIQPDERLLVIPAEIGQTAQRQAEQFHKSCSITGIIITKMDGTAKAGGALSAAAVSGAKIKFIGVGERPNDLETFNPPNFVSRLLGMGDLEALLEKAKEAISEEKSKDIEKRLLKGEFNLVDLYEQMQAMSKMGSLSKLMELVPGMSQLKLPKEVLDVHEDKLKHWKFGMNSMTKKELEEPELIDGSRIRRISSGSGVPASEIRDLLKQYRLAKKMMSSIKGKDPEKLMRKFKGRIPGM